MPINLGNEFKKIIDRFSGVAGGARPNLSVNSLSKLSTKFASALSGGPNQVETVRKTSAAICFTLSAWFLADLCALTAEKYLPNPPTSALSKRMNLAGQTSPLDYEVISNRNLFSSKAPKRNGNEIDMDAEPVMTNLPLNLIGTVIFRNPAKSMAALQDKGENKMYPVRMGDEIMNKVQVLSVEAKRVVFINTETRRKEFVEIPEDPANKVNRTTVSHSTTSDAAQEETHFTFARSDIDAQLGNLGNLLTQALAKPAMRGGQMVGFELVQIQKGSFYEKAGMKEHDIIKRVNGEPITDAAKAMALLGDIKNMATLGLTIERNGKDTEINYDIH